MKQLDALSRNITQYNSRGKSGNQAWRQMRKDWWIKERDWERIGGRSLKPAVIERF